MADILYQCPACGEWLEVPPDRLEQPVQCGRCHQATTPLPPVLPGLSEGGAVPGIVDPRETVGLEEPLTLSAQFREAPAPRDPELSDQGSVLYRVQSSGQSVPASPNAPAVPRRSEDAGRKGLRRPAVVGWRRLRLGLRLILFAWLLWALALVVSVAAIAVPASRSPGTVPTIFATDPVLRPLRTALFAAAAVRVLPLVAYFLFLFTPARRKPPAHMARRFAVALLAVCAVNGVASMFFAVADSRFRIAGVLGLHFGAYVELILLLYFLREAAFARGELWLSQRFGILAANLIVGGMIGWDLRHLQQDGFVTQLTVLAALALSANALLCCCCSGVLIPMSLFMGPGLCPLLPLAAAGRSVLQMLGVL